MKRLLSTSLALLLAPSVSAVTIRLDDCDTLHLADVTGDEIADYIILGPGGARVNHSSPDGTVVAPAAWTSPSSCVDSITWGDLDADGMTDLVTGCADDSHVSAWFGPDWLIGVSLDADDRENCGVSLAVGDVLLEGGEELIIGCPTARTGDRGEFRIYSLAGRQFADAGHNVNGAQAGSLMGSTVGTGDTRGPESIGAWYGVAPGQSTCAVVHVAAE